MQKLFPLLFAALLPLAAAAESVPIQRWQTADGTRVLLVERHDNPIVDIHIAFDAGSARDRADKIGVAGFTAALMDAGTRRLDEEALHERGSDLAVSLGSYGGTERAGVALRSLSKPEVLAPAVALMRDILVEPRFDPAVLRREQDRAVASLKQNLTRPEYLSQRAAAELNYGAHPYGFAARSSERSIRAVSVADMRTFHRRHFTRRNAVIAMVGDLDRSRAEAIVAQLTRDLPVGTALPAVPAPTERSGGQRHLPHPESQTHIRLTLPLIRHNDPDYYPLLVGNYILGGGGFDSRLMQTLRDRHGYTYGVSSDLAPMRQPGPFSISFATEKANAQAALAATRQVLADFIAQGPTEAELAQAKANLVGSFPLRFDTNAELTGYLIQIGFGNLPDDFLTRYPAAVAAVSTEDIRQAWQRRLQAEKLNTVTVGAPQ